MIITKLEGGLGNQMLQYSIGKSLATKLATNFKVDSSSLERDKDQLQGDYISRSLKLGVFNTDLTECSVEEKQKFSKGFFNTIKIFLASYLSITNLNIYYKEKSRMFDSLLFSLKANIYLEGYWPNHKYFESIRPQLLKDFTLKSKLEGKNEEFLNQILKSESVALHVRRSDYVTNSAAANHFASLSLGYYEKAIDYINNKVINPTFFIFSDDVDWVKANLKMQSNFIICDSNSIENGYIDLELMKHCKHFIIANSTFSWWGAWLSENKEKVVIAPNQWFRDDIMNKNEIVLSNWIRLPI